MSQWPATLRSIPFGAMALLAIAAALYVALLANAGSLAGGSGEERISQAYGGFIFMLLLWVVLALMLIVGGVMGHMPRWAALIAIPLHPLSGVAAFVALDAGSRNVNGALLFVALPPLVIAAYAMWARLTQFHASYPPQPVSAAAWGTIALLTMGGMATGL